MTAVTRALYFREGLVSAHSPAYRKMIKDRETANRARPEPTATLAGPYKPARDQKWNSHGCGVVYEPVKPTSKRGYARLQLERLARDVRAGAAKPGEITLTVPREPRNRWQAARAERAKRLRGE